MPDLLRRLVDRLRAAAAADGADDSGLAALLWAQALHAAGDTLVTVALASTVFFSVPLGQARGRVALYLVLTLLPFSLLVPVAGPLLDRFRHGRRNVLAASGLLRGLVAWTLAGALTGLALYPLALVVLVLSRAYGVARSAAVVRVRPAGVSLVAANARLTVAAVASASVAGAVGAGISRTAGPGWTLRLASLVLIGAGVAAVRLPPQVDEARPAERLAPGRYRLRDAPEVVRRRLVATVALRGLSGLLTVFLAFLLRAHGVPARLVVLVLGAAVAGQLLGTAAASRLPERVTARITTGVLVGPGLACAVAAVLGAPAWAALAAGASGLAGSLAKFSLDASLQAEVPAVSTSGAFARSETALQLAWALGGALGVVLPTAGALGFGVAALVPAGGVLVQARQSRSAGSG